MEITLAVVMSVDGKTTRGDEANIYDWTSPEDAIYFHKLVRNSAVMIMGSNTFDVSRGMILSRLTPKTLRLVVTRRPKDYRELSVPGQLEFTDKVPEEIVSDLTARGYSKALCIGGSELAESFFTNKLINYLYVTIEPTIFGIGKSFIPARSLQHISLQLLSSTRLNLQGTLLLTYEVYNA